MQPPAEYSVPVYSRVVPKQRAFVLLRRFACLILVSPALVIPSGCSNGDSSPTEPAPAVPTAESLPGDSPTTDTDLPANESTSVENEDSAPSTAGIESQPEPTGPVGPSPAPGSTTGAVSLSDFSDAAFEGNLKTVQKGIAQGIDINKANDDGNTPLMLAAFNGHTEVVELLISRDANVKAKNSVSRTALMFAATAPDNEATVAALIKAGASVNAVDGGEGYTALMFAAGEGHTSIAKLLLEAGADASIKDLDDESAAIHAANNKHIELARLLTKAAETK